MYTLAQIDAIAELDIGLMTTGAPSRPVPPIKPLLERGIRVCCGNDGIRDTWGPYGNGDMLERAMLIGYRGNYRRDEELAFTLDLVTTNAAKVLGLEDCGLRVGGPADLVVVEADTVAEAVATRPGRKMVIKAGRVVARDGALVS